MGFIKKTDIINRSRNKIASGKKVKAIVAFVDLLGFSDELAKNWSNDTDNFLHRIFRIRSFVELSKEVGNPMRFYDYDETTLIDTSEYPKLLSFSDSFIYIKELDESSDQSRITSILSLLGSILELWKYSIDEAFTIRGAVDYGEFFYSEHEIIGPAFISTYRMESKQAKISRVICSNEIRRLVTENIQNSHPKFKDYCQLWFKEDIDKALILNPCVAFNLFNHIDLDEAKQKVENMRLNSNDHEARNKYFDLIEKLANRIIEFSNMQIFDIK